MNARAVRAALGIVSLLPAAACAPRSIFDPAGPAARQVSRLGAFVLIAFSITTVVMWILVWYVAYRRRGTLSEHAPIDAGGGINWILIGGFAVPAVVLAIVFVVTLRSMSAFPLEARDAEPDLRVIGHQWWFEVEYRMGGLPQWVTTTTEIHLPVGTPVDIALQSRDVIHSFWIPELHGKVDLMPDFENHMRVQADRPGRYGGQCAEFCGPQHANMRLEVVAETPAEFARWLAAQRAPAAVPESPDAVRGRQVFERQACAMCHTVRGTAAKGRIGPELTHVASRRRVAGGMLENTPDNLRTWVVAAQTLKPGAQMPNLPMIDDDQADALVAYLRTLR
jgi:cytochrome c oxidase subunit 2